jgi:hypothetical protein
LRLEEVREALEVFAKQRHLAAIEVTAYNPTRDSDGSGAKVIIDLLADVLGRRLEAFGPAPAVAESSAVASAPVPAAEVPSPQGQEPPEQESALPAVATGEAWSSENLEVSSESSEPAVEPPDAGSSETAGETKEPQS